MGQKSFLESMIFGNTYCYFPSNQAECIFYACRFLSLEHRSSPQLIDEVMNAPYRGEKDSNVHTIALEFNKFYKPYVKVPYVIDNRDIDYFDPKELATNEFINVEADYAAYVNLCHFIKETPRIHGAVITGNNIAVGMRKKKGLLEFFDPTGDQTITKNNGHAYVRYSVDEADAASYLFYRFPSSPEGGDLSPLISVWNFHLIK